MLEILSRYNKDVNDVVLQNAPRNASYTSPQIQKEILSIFASKVQCAIRSEIGDAKFCVIVDEARDEAKKNKCLLFYDLWISLVLFKSVSFLLFMC